MAPRKDATGPAPSASQSQQDASSEGIEDFELPRVLVAQLAKSTLPLDSKLDDDTVTALVKGSTVFINYLTAAAQDIAAGRAHKTISGADVLKALESLQFGDLVTAFQGELEVFRQGNKSRSKATVDAKGKGTDSSVGIRPAQTQGNTSSAMPTLHIVVPHAPELPPNGSLAVDAELRDTGEEEINNHDIQVTHPIE